MVINEILKVGSEGEKFIFRPVTRLKQRKNRNKLNICLSLLLFIIMLTLVCVSVTKFLKAG